jgi:hypothetical protein
MTDTELLAEVLRRFLMAREYFFVNDDHLTLDGKVDISDEELGAILRVTEGWIEAHRVVGQADEEFYALTPTPE